ncbi:receptor-like kinase TMK4 isoform X2 [Macadamia integrifolia]|uniref:receptor-like kinase TMK4 isoform X2 n=1 Tax=Macadamia integrifolia TaxID=60698 RepID=UPI001C4F8B2E|nr:receptor-like kinase TMK4 isoform X2 [Macadamia integrifolia]
MRERKMLFSPFFFFFFFFFFLIHFSPTVADDGAIMNQLATTLYSIPKDWKGNAYCSWSGIACDKSKRVTSISLASEGLGGTLPPDLNQLSELQTLSLQNNKISGALPSLANLTNLQEVYVDNNNFTSIPRTFFTGLTSLQNMSISQNEKLEPWSIPTDLADSSSLVVFYASKANAIGSGIQNLWLNNQVVGLSGTIDVLGTMTQLSQVWLHQNAFTGSIPDLSKCTSLVDLQLRGNQLTGVIPSSLVSLSQLMNVSLDNNKFQGPLPAFGNGVKITLGTTNNFCNSKPGPCSPQVTALLAVAGKLGYPENLATSWGGNDPCQGWTFITCDAQKKNVTIVNFAKQKFTGSISPSFANLTSLRNLLLNDNDLSGSIPSDLINLNQLVILDVSNNNLSGPVPVFPKGVTLKMAGNKYLGSNITSGLGGEAPEESPQSSPIADSPTGSGKSSSPGAKKSSSMSSGLVAGIVVAAVLVMVVAVFVIYKCYAKKRKEKIGLVPLPQNEKEIGKNGSVGTANGYGGFGGELQSQSSDNSDVQVFDGAHVTISIQVLREVTNNFSEDNILGRGGFGVVYKGVLHDGTQIAVKRMESTAMGTKGLSEFQAEIAVLTKVRHRHLVALLGFCINGSERLLVYEYMPQGDLGQRLFNLNKNGYPPLTWKQRVTIALDVARGVEYLHGLAQQSFIHRDLKPSNVLLGDDMRAKVADFGLVKNAPDGKYSVETRLAGTFGYLAPEYAATGRVTTKVDVYAYGVVLMELITGRKALDENMPEEHLVTWFRRVLINKDNIGKAVDPVLNPDDETLGIILKVAELAGHCTAREPSQRPDMGHAVNILAPLVEQWTPSSQNEEDDYGIDLHLSLPQVLERWQSEGTTSIVGDSFYNSSSITSRGDTQSSIPTKPSGFNDTFNSTDCR